MKMYQIKLVPLSSIFQCFPTSDTLFGAICWGIKRIYGETTLCEILNDFPKKPKFVISSSFPYLEGNKSSITFFPKPVFTGVKISDINEISGNDKKSKVDIIGRYKKFKTVEYVSGSVFNEILDGFSEKFLFKRFLNEEYVISSGILMEREKLEECFNSSNVIYSIELVQKNSIDRLRMSTGEIGQTFYQQEYYTSNSFRLHFLIKTEELNFFMPVFRYLEDKGIGGNRSTGKGRYKIEVIGEIKIGDDSSSKFVTLSRYIMDMDEAEPISYEIFPIRSKVDSEAEFKGEDVWKSRVMYIKEGSIIEAKQKKEFYGKIPIVKEIDGKKIYQNGIAFPVFGKLGG
jgi:CRISPR-associated protein Csm4